MTNIGDALDANDAVATKAALETTELKALANEAAIPLAKSELRGGVSAYRDTLAKINSALEAHKAGVFNRAVSGALRDDKTLFSNVGTGSTIELPDIVGVDISDSDLGRSVEFTGPVKVYVKTPFKIPSEGATVRVAAEIKCVEDGTSNAVKLGVEYLDEDFNYISDTTHTLDSDLTTADGAILAAGGEYDFSVIKSSNVWARFYVEVTSGVNAIGFLTWYRPVETVVSAPLGPTL